MTQIDFESSMIPPRFVRALLLTLIGAGCCVALLAALYGNINLDEYQFILNGWDVFRGLSPYRDFWDNHGPAANYVWAPLFNFCLPTHEVVFFFRGIAFLTTVLTAFFTGLLAREALGRMKYAGLTAAGLLLSSPLYIEKARDVRGDIFLTLLWTAGLFFLVRAVRRNHPSHAFVSGLLIGAALWFTPKAIFLVMGALLLLATESLLRRRLATVHIIAMSGGIALALLGLALWLWDENLLQPFSQLVLFESIARKRTLAISPFTNLCQAHPWWLGGCLVCVFIVVRGCAKQKPIHRPLYWFAPLGVFFLAYYFIILPSRHPQSLLPLHPIIAVLWTWLLWRGCRVASGFTHNAGSRHWGVFGSIVVLVTLHTVGIVARQPYVLGNLPKQVAAGNVLAVRVPPDEKVLTGEGLPLFRPSPLFAHVLVNYLREMYFLGKAPFDIPSALQKEQVRFVTVDPRILSLPAQDLVFLRDNYLPVAKCRVGKKRFLLAGGKIIHADTQSTTFSIDIAGCYWVSYDTAKVESLSIDGASTTATCYLSAGPHLLSVTHAPTTAVLSMVHPKHLDWGTINSNEGALLDKWIPSVERERDTIKDAD